MRSDFFTRALYANVPPEGPLPRPLWLIRGCSHCGSIILPPDLEVRFVTLKCTNREAIGAMQLNDDTPFRSD